MLAFGTITGATDTLDQGVDLLSPPPPPRVFDAFFQIEHPLFPNLMEDFRSDTVNTISWDLIINATNDGIGIISWDASLFPFIDSLQLEIRSGDTVLADMLAVESLEFIGDQKLEIVLFQQKDSIDCEVTILSPANGEQISSDSVLVTTAIHVVNGLPPFNVQCEINGIEADSSESNFSAIIPLIPGENKIITIHTVTDSLGEQAVCSDTISVFRESPLQCEVEILSPQNEIVCDREIEVTGVTRVSGGVSPVINCEVNGITAILLDSIFTASVPIKSKVNSIIALCTVIDSLGKQLICTDTISVFLDTKAY